MLYRRIESKSPCGFFPLLLTAENIVVMDQFSYSQKSYDRQQIQQIDIDYTYNQNGIHRLNPYTYYAFLYIEE